jgi:hypothetical protein
VVLPPGSKGGASDTGPPSPLLRRRSSKGTGLGDDLGPVSDGPSFHELCYRPGYLFAALRRWFDRVGVIPRFGAD